MNEKVIIYFNLFQIRESTLGAVRAPAEGSDQKSSRRMAFAGDVVTVRSVFRKASILDQDQVEHHSLSGEILSKDLVNFSVLAAQSMSFFIQNHLFNSAEGVAMDIIYVTEKEREEKTTLAKQTKEDLKKLIFKELLKLDSDTSKLQSEYFKKIVSKKPRSEYVSFYFQIKEMMAP